MSQGLARDFPSWPGSSVSKSSVGNSGTGFYLAAIHYIKNLYIVPQFRRVSFTGVKDVDEVLVSSLNQLQTSVRT